MALAALRRWCHPLPRWSRMQQGKLEAKTNRRKCANCNKPSQMMSSSRSVLAAINVAIVRNLVKSPIGRPRIKRNASNWQLCLKLVSN
jgi:hypothetical protein